MFPCWPIIFNCSLPVIVRRRDPQVLQLVLPHILPLLVTNTLLTVAHTVSVVTHVTSPYQVVLAPSWGCVRAGVGQIIHHDVVVQFHWVAAEGTRGLYWCLQKVSGNWEIKRTKRVRRSGSLGLSELSCKMEILKAKVEEIHYSTHDHYQRTNYTKLSKANN